MTDSPNEDTPSTEPHSHDKNDYTFTPEELVDWVESVVSMLESVDKSSGQHWCSQWWAHPEAVERFRALMEKWMEFDKHGGMSTWWTDHFDRHAAVLFAKRGPFGECGTKHVEKGIRRTLVTEQPPSDWSW